MKEFNKLIIIFILSSILISPILLNAQKLSKENLLPDLIHMGLVQWHISNIKIDDKFSEKAFESFLRVIDGNKQFLLKNDVDNLKMYIHEIDNQIKRREYHFMKKVQAVLQNRLKTIKALSKIILAKGFDFSLDEYIQLSNENRKYATDINNLKEYWRKLLKYQALTRYVNLIKSNKKSKKKKTKKEMKKNVMKSLKKSIDSYFSNQEKKVKFDIFDNYINSLMDIFDPHTSYFPPKEQEDFNISMTGSFEGIGALLGERDGLVSIERIIPGGPCWNQKKLGPGDLILKVTSKGKTPVDIVGYRSIDAVKLIRGKKGSTVVLTVKKPSGQIKDVSIIRGVVVLEESYAKSAIYTHKKINKKIGYILLPQFYRDFKSVNGRDSFSDLKKELIRLNKLKVDGLIFDLRWNSGGALLDAVKISGLFIDKGPIVQVRGRQKKTKILKDDEAGMVFKKPVIILVNSASASASEILAGALQDYCRAIIVGNNKTFGKGTVQTMVDISSLVRNNPENIKLGALKFTIQKFYRVTGNSNQSKGVTPDIVLSHQLDHLNLGETNYKNYLAWDVISPTAFVKENMVDKNILKELNQSSNIRLSKDISFQKNLQNIEVLKKQMNKINLSLNLKKNLLEQKELAANSNKLPVVDQKDISILSTTDKNSTNNKQDPKLLKIEQEKEKQLLEDIKKDIYIKECVFILNDWINILKKKSPNNN